MKKLVVGIPCGKSFGVIIANIAGYGITDCLIHKLSEELDNKDYILYDSVKYIEYNLFEEELENPYDFPKVIVALELNYNEDELERVDEHSYSIPRDQLRDVIFEEKYSITKCFIGKDYYYDMEEIILYDRGSDTRECALLRLVVRLEAYANNQLDEMIKMMEDFKKDHPKAFDVDNVITNMKKVRNGCYMYKPLELITNDLVKVAKRFSAIDERPSKIFNKIIRINNSTLTLRRSLSEIVKMRGLRR